MPSIDAYAVRMISLTAGEFVAQSLVKGRAWAGYRQIEARRRPNGFAVKFSTMDPFTGTLLLVAAKAAGTGAGKELAQFVGPMVGLVNAQKKVLDEIRRDTEALVDAPFVAAQTQLRAAALAEDQNHQRERLVAAEAKFLDAAAQLTDPLKRSYSWTGSALINAHLRPKERSIAEDHFMNAYVAAVQAGQQAADTDPFVAPQWASKPARAFSWLFKWAMPVRLRLRWRRRPQSLRISTSASVSLPRLGGFRVTTYNVTDAALEREHRLAEITSHVKALGEILMEYGKSRAEVLEYRFGLEEDTQFQSGPSWSHTETTYWALVFEPVDSVEDPSTSIPALRSQDQEWIKFERIRGR